MKIPAWALQPKTLIGVGIGLAAGYRFVWPTIKNLFRKSPDAVEQELYDSGAADEPPVNLDAPSETVPELAVDVPEGDAPEAEAPSMDPDSIIAWTAKNESGGIRNPYAAINRNTDGSGISFGFIQFSQRPGSLGMLLTAMREADAMAFETVFGGPALAQAILDTTNGEPQRRELAHSPSAGPGAGTLAMPLWQEPYVSMFKEAGADPVFQQVQRAEAKRRYYDPMSKLADAYGVESVRGLTLLFDRAVQQGPGKLAQMMRETALVTPPPTQGGDEYTFLQAIAETAASPQYNGGWGDAVRRRNDTILYSEELTD